jgi:hypothetical protein
MANVLRRSALSRRTLLRGAGAAIALPLLSAMVPALTAADRTPAVPVKRFGFVFLPMGADMSRWTPAGGNGPLGDLPFILQPLAPVRDQLNVLSNVDLQPAYPGSHATSNSAFLSAARAKHTESNDYRLGTTIDQRIASHLLGATQLPSLELARDMLQVVGQCDNGYACVYQNNLSWSSPTTPLPAEAHPRLVFEQLFGEGGTPAERRARSPAWTWRGCWCRPGPRSTAAPARRSANTATWRSLAPRRCSSRRRAPTCLTCNSWSIQEPSPTPPLPLAPPR